MRPPLLDEPVGGRLTGVLYCRPHRNSFHFFVGEILKKKKRRNKGPEQFKRAFTRPRDVPNPDYATATLLRLPILGRTWNAPCRRSRETIFPLTTFIA
jgi:hypothetical protein